MMSIFAADLSKPCQTTAAFRAGPVFTADTIALVTDVAHHFDLDFTAVEDVLAPILPQTGSAIRTPAGWSQLGEHVGAHFQLNAPLFWPKIH